MSPDLGEHGGTELSRYWSPTSVIIYVAEKKAILSVTAQGKGVHCVDLGESFPTSIF